MTPDSVGYVVRVPGSGCMASFFSTLMRFAPGVPASPVFAGGGGAAGSQLASGIAWRTVNAVPSNMPVTTYPPQRVVPDCR